MSANGELKQGTEEGGRGESGEENKEKKRNECNNRVGTSHCVNGDTLLD